MVRLGTPAAGGLSRGAFQAAGAVPVKRSKNTQDEFKSWSVYHVFLIVYTHIHTHTYIHASMHTDKHTFIHTYIHTDTHTDIHTYIPTYIHTYIHTYIIVDLMYSFSPNDPNIKSQRSLYSPAAGVGETRTFSIGWVPQVRGIPEVPQVGASPATSPVGVG